MYCITFLSCILPQLPHNYIKPITLYDPHSGRGTFFLQLEKTLSKEAPAGNSTLVGEQLPVSVSLSINLLVSGYPPARLWRGNAPGPHVSVRIFPDSFGRTFTRSNFRAAGNRTIPVQYPIWIFCSLRFRKCSNRLQFRTEVPQELLIPHFVRAAGNRTRSTCTFTRSPLLTLVGVPGNAPGPHAPHACILLLYYTPKILSNRLPLYLPRGKSS